MPKICYVPDLPLLKNQAQLTIVKGAVSIIQKFGAQGYDLTLRQLYYQFVARGWIANKDSEYKRLGAIITDARLAGLVDWDAIVDRTRNLKGLTHWGSPQELLQNAAKGYHIDKWADQPYRVEVWIEKDALAGVFSAVCQSLDVPYFSCRGYTSASEMWAAGRRLREYRRRGQIPVILHFGDHDPSGVDMSRDLRKRLSLFAEGEILVRRRALNMAQVEFYHPPPNPTKLSDGRAKRYIAKYGHSSWELDALEPSVLSALVTSGVAKLRDEAKWAVQIAKETEGRARLKKLAQTLTEES